MNCPWCQKECRKEKLGEPSSSLSHYVCHCSTGDKSFEAYTNDDDFHSYMLKTDLGEHYMVMSWVDDEDYGKRYKIAIKERVSNIDINIIARGIEEISIDEAAHRLNRYLKLLVFI